VISEIASGTAYPRNDRNLRVKNKRSFKCSGFLRKT